MIPSGNSHLVLLVFRTPPPCTGLTSCRLFSVRSHPDILSILRVIQNPSILMPAKDRLLAALLLQLDTLPGLVIDPLHPASQPSRILAHLNAHFREELSLTDLSDQFHLTPSHIIHIFNALYGLSRSNTSTSGVSGKRSSCCAPQPIMRAISPAGSVSSTAITFITRSSVWSACHPAITAA